MVKLRMFNYLATVALLTGCSGVSVTPMLTPISHLSPSPTLSLPSDPTLLATPDLTATPNSEVSFECVNIYHGFEANSIVNGTFIVKNLSKGDVYLWDIKTDDNILVPAKENEILMDFMVSPNGQWLAYTRSIVDGVATISKHLEIMSSNGQPYTAVPIDPSIANLSRWLDDERLLFRKDLTIASPRIVINPFTLDQQEIDPSFPDLYDNNPVLDWSNQGIVVYDPTLELAVYAGLPADVVLKDIKRDHIISRISPVPIADVKPLWAPDGSQFIIANADISDPQNLHYEIYSIDRDGQVNQLTNLASYYQSVFILSHTWSPDGQYIAFWLEGNQKSEVVSLAVLDLTTLQVVNYCIESTYKGYNAPPPTFWSPDSNQLVVETTGLTSDTGTRLVLLDITTSQAFRIAENLTPLGWLIDKP